MSSICKLCKTSFSSKELLSFHMKSHLIQPFSCSNCHRSFRFSSYHKLKTDCSSLKAQFPNSVRLSNAKTIWKCRHCNRIFNTRCQLKRHMFLCPHQRLYSCGYCLKVFSRRNSFGIHLNSHATDELNFCNICKCKELCCHVSADVLKYPYLCDLCNSSFKSKTKLYDHLLFHKNVNSVSCSVCSMVFRNENCLKLHATWNHIQRLYMCPKCPKTFSFKSFLNNHLKRHVKSYWPLKKRPEVLQSQKCLFCKKLSSYTTGTLKRFQCPLCQKSMRFQSTFERHFQLHLAKKNFICKICHEKFPSKDFSEHMKIHFDSSGEEDISSKPSKIECCYCSEHFSSTEELNRHFPVHPNKVKLMCKVCKTNFEETSALLSHLKNHEKAKPIFKSNYEVEHNYMKCGKSKNWCHMCLRRFFDESGLVAHLQIHSIQKQISVSGELNSEAMTSANTSDEKTKNSPQEIFVCKFCQKLFSSEKLCVQHAQIHLANCFCCPICDKTFDDKKILMTHLKLHNASKLKSEPVIIPLKRKICKICKKTFKSQSHLINHYRIHVNEKSFTVKKIQKGLDTQLSSSTGAGIDDIMHPGNKRNISTMTTEHSIQVYYPCKKCNLTFSDLTPFVEHLLKHSEKIYVCEECEKEFEDKKKLLNHKKMHKIDNQLSFFGKENMKIHECNYCLKVFLFRSSLLEHLEEHTGTNLHECATCGEAFTEVMDFVNHTEIHGPVWTDHDTSLLKKGESDKKISKSKLDTFLDETSDEQTEDSQPIGLGQQSNSNIQKYYECKTCSKTFKKVAVYQQHLLKHSKRHFECSKCKKRFTRAASLKRHSLVHSSVEVASHNDAGSVHTTGEHDYAHQDSYDDEKTDKDIANKSVLKSTKYVHQTEVKVEQRSLLKKQQGKRKDMEIPTTKENAIQEKRVKFSNPPETVTETCLKTASEVAVFHDNNSQYDSDVYICSFCQGLCKGGDNFLKHLKSHGDVDLKVKHVKLQPVSEVLENSEQPTESPSISKTVDISNPNNTLETLLLECGAIRSVDETEEEVLMKPQIPETVTAIEGLEIQNTLTADELILIDAAKEYIENHPAENVQICGCCLDIYQTRNDLHEHLKTHSVEDRTFCKICIRRYREDKEPCAHLRIYTDEMKFLCEYCAKAFATKSDLTCHLPTHTKEKPFVCHICDMGFRHRGFLNAHIRIHTGEKPFLCQYCTKAFRVKSSLNKHIRMHTGEKPHVCGYCLKAYARKISLTTHLQCHTNDVLSACRVCNKDLLNSSDLCRHVSSSVQEKPHACEHCGKLFFTKNELVIHLRTHLGPRPFKCHLCDRSFNVPGSVTLHIKSCHNEDTHPYQCLICNRTFAHKSKLIKHLQRQHKDQNLFLCKFCDEYFDTQEKLEEHSAIHPRHRNATLPCPFCKKSFLRKTTFDNHLAKHHEKMQQKPLFCKICSKTLSTRNSYMEHLRMHISKKSLVCNICNEVCQGRASLRQHMQQHCMEANTAEANAIATLHTMEGGNFAFSEGVAIQVIQLEVETAPVDPQYVGAEIVVG